MAFKDPFPPKTQPKTPKAEVGYREGDGLRRCSKCAHFEPPHGCQTIAGGISPSGYCVRWELAEGAERERRDIGGPT